MLLTNPNYTTSKNHGDNGNKSNHNSNRIGDKKPRLDNLEGFELFCNMNYRQKVFDHT